MFSYHGKGTWLPDNPRGFVHRKYGLQPPDENMADHYRANMKDAPVSFTDEMMTLVFNTARHAGNFIDATMHGCGAEPSHIHMLVSWNHDREFESMRASIRSAMSRALNQTFGKREWFSDSPSRKRVRTHEHFDYLALVYLPDHTHSWVREEDRTAAQERDKDRERPVTSRRKRRKHRSTNE